ncbi:MAG: hypothetical protein PHZ17_06555 [Sulfurovum sp.]|nr:hypothetical protein [Sulfurovum sp.]
MKFLFFVCVPIMLFSQTYMAKIEPFDNFIIYAQTNGQIVYLDKNDETKVVDKTIVKLDDSLEQKELAGYKMQLRLYEEKLKLLNKNYQKYLQVAGKSAFEKDEKYYQILDLKVTIENLKIEIAKLEDTIAKKHISVRNLYIKQFKTNNGDYVTAGTQLADAYDISSARAVVFVSRSDYENIENKKILIDGKQESATIYKIDKIQDETMISAYRVELLLQRDDFGKIVEVEFISS